MNKTLGIVEHFVSIQGEGPSTGRPALFIRLGGCNLGCPKCDTPYAVFYPDHQFKHPEGKTWDPAEEIQQYESWQFDMMLRYVRIAYPKVQLIVLTGGEPLVQQKVLMGGFIQSMIRWSDRIEIETNGTITPDLRLSASPKVHFNTSPKLSGFGGVPEKFRRRSSALSFFSGHPRSVFKFVIQTDEDEDEVIEWVRTGGIPPHKVLIMPEGVTAEEIAARSKALVQLCIREGFQFCNRLHVQIWGAIRGV